MLSSFSGWGSNTGIARATVRVDGFGSLTAPYEFSDNVSALSYFETAALQLPAAGACAASLQLHLNVQTSVAGYVATELRDASTGAALPAFSAQNADPVRGNFVRRPVSWLGATSLNSLTGRAILVRVYAADAHIFSLTFRCDQ